MTKLDGTKHPILMSEAVSAAKMGKKPLARKLLRELVEKEPRNERAWLWIAALSDTQDEAHHALLTVLEINPGNEQAMNALAMARLNEAANRPQYTDRPPLDGSPAACSSQEGERRATLRPPTWKCSLCGAQSAVQERKCPRCGVILSMTNLEELADNRGVSEDLLLEAIQRQQEILAKEPTYEAHLMLAYAFLNLNRSAEAVPHLKKAAALRPGLAGIEHALEKLQSRRLILAVDDSSTVRKLVATTLERHGYRVLTASDGMQALARLNEEVPDLILLDITMPRMDGYQVCKIIKQNAYTKSIPVVMLSGKDGFFDKVKGRLAGATDYLTKPFPDENLAKSVSKHLAKRT
jgi:twitching motility two-component system response regulator PilG